MGKASRRKNQQAPTGPAPAPFMRRPFEGLPGETDWVAMREIVPAASATVRLRADAPAVLAAVANSADSADSSKSADFPQSVSIVTVLPGAWPGIRRADGLLEVGLQAGSASRDPSRDYAQVILTMLASPDGTPVPTTAPATIDTPRLQDILDLSAPFEVIVHDTFDFWLAADTQLNDEERASLTEANESILPTTRMTSAESAYWVRVGGRTHIRWILPHDEDAATDALARLHAAGKDTLGPNTRLLGAFRAGGLLAPVWDLDPELEAADYEKPLAAVDKALTAALKDSSPLTPEQRRAKAGLLSRQLTLR